jgi:small subunit ribosomal protein S21
MSKNPKIIFVYKDKIHIFAPLNLKATVKMLIVQIKEGDNIEKALKKYKKKFEKTGVVKQLRERSKFTKPSVRRREEVIKATYKQKLQIGAIEK